MPTKKVKSEHSIALRKRIRQARLAKGMSQQELGTAMGGRLKGTVCNWEHGWFLPSAKDLLKLADRLEVSVGWLTSTEDREAPPEPLRQRALPRMAEPEPAPPAPATSTTAQESQPEFDPTEFAEWNRRYEMYLEWKRSGGGGAAGSLFTKWNRERRRRGVRKGTCERVPFARTGGAGVSVAG